MRQMPVVPGQNWSSLRRVLLSIYLDLKIVINQQIYLKFVNVSRFRFHLLKMTSGYPEGDVSRCPQLSYTKCICSWKDPTYLLRNPAVINLCEPSSSVPASTHTNPMNRMKLDIRWVRHFSFAIRLKLFFFLWLFRPLSRSIDIFVIH